MAAEGPFRNSAGGVVDQITMRQIGDFFGIMRPADLWDHGMIGNQVIVVIGAHGAGVAQIAHLHRRGAHGEYARPAVSGMSAQIDGNIDFQISRQVLQLPGRSMISNVDKTVDTCFQPGFHRIFSMEP